MAIRLAEERKKRGWSQYDLARAANIHPTDISKIESGRFPCFEGWRQRIIKALDWPPERADELFTQEGGN